MEFEQRIRIIKRFLNEKIFAAELKDEELASFADLEKLLDYIDLHNNGLFDLQTLEADPDQWREFCGIIKYSSTFEKESSPPRLKAIDLNKAEDGIRYTLNAHEVLRLPKDDYYERPTHLPQEMDHELEDLIIKCREKLYAISQTFPEATPFDASSSSQITQLIQRLEEERIRLLNDDPEREKVGKKLNILLDLNKINELKRINIPQDNGTNIPYCILQEHVEGVTEKIALIRLESVKNRLHLLCDKAEGLGIENYSTEREHYKLSTEAIIKLPKHGNIKEVQHEAMALNISRLIGLDTASSTTIFYNGHPGLFIPFEEIRLLSEFSLGKTFYGWMLGKSYTHYSTIKTLGEGLQADCFIHDFGNVLGLIYLCSDTDTVGNNCQNKALRNAQSLFVFDQSLMDTDKFILDSRLCLIPGEFLKKHTRHGLGRNRTIIEDSSMDTKFNSIMQLRSIGDKILQYAIHVAWQHHQQARRIQRQFKKALSTQKQSELTSALSDLMLLEKDAELLKLKILERLEAIDNIFPQTIGNVDATEIKQAFIFEKLIHNPILFSDDGRPFKYPWTHRQPNKIKKIEELENGLIQMTFSDKVSSVMVDFIKRRGGGDLINDISAKTVTLSKVHFAALRDDLLHPEYKLALDPTINYLDPADLGVIKEAYNIGNRTYLLNLIKNYRKKMSCDKASTDEKLKCIIETEERLRELISTAHDRGFGMHVLKKFFFDAQQQLQKLIPPLKMPMKLNEAFTAALKLDRVSEFNATVLEAIKQDKITNQSFISFLDECILRAGAATNYIQAHEESSTISSSAKNVIQQLQTISMPWSQFLGASMQQKGLNEAEPIIISDTKNEKEEELVVNSSPPPSTRLDMIHEESTGMSCKC